MKGCPKCKARYVGNPTRCPIDGAALQELADPLLGQVVGGRYRIIDKIGEGGMGAIYRGRHDVLGRDVAVKFLSERYCKDETHKERFLREARAANRINHENIIDIHDFGETEQKQVYLVMELLQGEPLSRLIARGPIQWERAIEILAQVVRAVARAHELEVIHRDLKPDNIFLLEREGHSDFVKVLDFGLARVKGELRLTHTGAVFGTPEYMSPEQAAGQPVGAASDLYSLGVIFFEMLSGQLPFQGRTAELMVAHLRHHPPDLRQIARNVPPELGAMVTRLLSKDAAARHRDAYHLLDELGSVKQRYGAASRAPAAPTRSVPAPTGIEATQPLAQSIPSWGARVAVFRKIAGQAYSGKTMPTWLTETIGDMERLVAEGNAIQRELAAMTTAIESLEARARDLRDRIGFALDELGRDHSRAVRDVAEVEEAIVRTDGRVRDARGAFERARRAVLSTEADPTVSEEVLAPAYEACGRRAEALLARLDERREIEDRRSKSIRMREDLEFQMSQLRGRLGAAHAEVEMQLADHRARLAAQGDASTRNSARLSEVASKLSEHLAAFPALREALYRQLTSPPAN
jgi:serine/threonine-protein kinase